MTYTTLHYSAFMLAMRMWAICSSLVDFLRSLWIKPALLKRRSTAADVACAAKNWRAKRERLGNPVACSAHHSSTQPSASRVGNKFM